MTEKSPGGLIAPRRRTERETLSNEPPRGSGVPVISRIPSLAKADARRTNRAVEHASRVAHQPPEAEQSDANQPDLKQPELKHHDLKRSDLKRDDLKHGDLKRRDGDEREIRSAPGHVPPASGESKSVHGVHEGTDRRGLMATIVAYPWNNLLLSLSMAALLLLTLLMLTRLRPAAMTPPTPPTVHYHMMPPAEYTNVPPVIPGPAAAAAGAAVDQPADPQGRVARRLEPTKLALDRATVVDSAPPGAAEAMVDSAAERSADTRATGVSGQTHEAYPATGFPDLPLPPPAAGSDLGNPNPTEPGARLNGNIQEFKK